MDDESLGDLDHLQVLFTISPLEAASFHMLPSDVAPESILVVKVPEDQQAVPEDAFAGCSALVSVEMTLNSINWLAAHWFFWRFFHVFSMIILIDLYFVGHSDHFWNASFLWKSFWDDLIFFSDVSLNTSSSLSYQDRFGDLHRILRLLGLSRLGTAVAQWPAALHWRSGLLELSRLEKPETSWHGNLALLKVERNH